MKTVHNIAALILLFGAPIALAPSATFAQDAPAQASNSKSTKEASPGDVYYYFTMGHLQEQQYEITNNSDAATQAIELYKKALELEPSSPVIMERLAEMYAKSQRIREAVAEAQLVLKSDPDNVAAHRLLARIYVRTLGDMSGGPAQKENLARAVEQFQAILEDRAGRRLSPPSGSRACTASKTSTTTLKRFCATFCNHDADNGPGSGAVEPAADG